MNLLRVRVGILVLSLALIVSCGGGGGGGGGDAGGGGGSYPTIPTGLTVSASGSQINLSWNASTSDVAMAGYNIFRNGSPYIFVAGTSYSDTGVTAGVQYCYTVQALDTDGKISEECTQQCAGITAPPGGATFTIRQESALIALSAVAWNGSQFLAAGEQYYTFSSTNGSKWTRSGSSYSLPYDINDLLWDGSKFVAATGFGDIYTSSNGSGWSLRYEGSIFNDLFSVARSGSAYVVVGQDAILSSPDAVTWTSRWPAAETINFNDVVWDGSKFVVVGNSGSIRTSPTGSDWTQQMSPTTHQLNAIASSGSRLCAAGLVDAVTSTNGTDWTKTALPDGAWLEAIAWSPTLSMFAAVNYSGDKIMTSPDCVSWTTYTQTSDYLYNITWENGQFTAVGFPAEIITSTDGVNWVPRMSGGELRGVTWTGSKFIAASWSAGRTMSSADGITWSYSSTGKSNRAWNVRWSNTFGLALVVGQQSNSSAAIWTSPDGDAWTEQLGWIGAASNLYGITEGNGMLVAVGASSGGIIYTSTTGTSWEYQPSGNTTYTLKDVAWNDSKFVAVGYNGTILSSSTGTTWVAETSGITNDLYAVTWTGNEFVAVGMSGTILTSPDGTNWATQTSGTTSSLYSVVADGTSIYAAGSGGTVYKSTNGGATWSSIGKAMTTSIYGMASSPSQFVLVGGYGTIATKN